MKTKHLVPVLLGLATLAFFTADASAMYNPATGTFMQRDPGPGGMMAAPAPRIAGEGVMGGSFVPRDPSRQFFGQTEQSEVVQNAFASSFMSMSRVFDANTIRNNPSLLQFADGMNIYQYLGGDPVDFADPSGLDRYIEHQTVVHYYIVVPEWSEDCCRILQWWRFDFSPKSIWWGPAAAIVVPGLVTKAQASEPGSNGTKVTSTCWEDKVLFDKLGDQVSDPPLYNALFYNCIDWTLNMAGKGLVGGSVYSRM